MRVLLVSVAVSLAVLATVTCVTLARLHRAVWAAHREASE